MRASVLLSSLILMVVTCAGCSLTAIRPVRFCKRSFEPEGRKSEKNWHVVWRKRVYQVYAINHQSGTFFANERAFLAALTVGGFGQAMCTALWAKNGGGEQSRIG